MSFADTRNPSPVTWRADRSRYLWSFVLLGVLAATVAGEYSIVWGGWVDSGGIWISIGIAFLAWALIHLSYALLRRYQLSLLAIVGLSFLMGAGSLWLARSLVMGVASGDFAAALYYAGIFLFALVPSSVLAGAAAAFVAVRLTHRLPAASS